MTERKGGLGGLDNNKQGGKVQAVVSLLWIEREREDVVVWMSVSGV